MSWIHRRRDKPDPAEAKAAIERAREDRDEIRRIAPWIHRNSRILKARRESDDFGEGFIRILRGDPPK